MHLSTIAVLIATSFGLARSADDHWCGAWAGTPNPASLPSEQQLPANEATRRFFVEPQLTKVPYSPIIAIEPKVQVPKVWGNGKLSGKE